MVVESGSVLGGSAAIGLLLGQVDGGIDGVLILHVLPHGRVGQVRPIAHLALVVPAVGVVSRSADAPSDRVFRVLS